MASTVEPEIQIDYLNFKPFAFEVEPFAFEVEPFAFAFEVEPFAFEVML